MKTKIFILIVIIVGAHCNVPLQMPLQAQELPDTVWSKKLDNNNFNNSIIFSPDGKFIYIVNLYDILKIETSTGDIIYTSKSDLTYMKSIDVSPTGDSIITTGNEYLIMWNAINGDTLFTLKKGNEACFTPDGKRIILLTGTRNWTGEIIDIIDIDTKKIIKNFRTTYRNLKNLFISPDGKYFSYNISNTIIVDLNTYEEIKYLENQQSFGFSPDGKMIGTSSSQGINLWDINTFKLMKNINYYSEDGLSDEGRGQIIFSNDSKCIIYGYYDWLDYNPNKIIVWNIEGDSLQYEYNFSGSKAIDISKDDYIAAVGYDLIKGGQINLLRPKWKETDVIENSNVYFKYSYSNGKLKIDFDDIPFNKPEIKIYNILGIPVGANGRSPAQTSNIIEMDLNHLPSGIYFVVVDIGGEMCVIKLMK